MFRPVFLVLTQLASPALADKFRRVGTGPSPPPTPSPKYPCDCPDDRVAPSIANAAVGVAWRRPKGHSPNWYHDELPVALNIKHGIKQDGLSNLPNYRNGRWGWRVLVEPQ